MKLLSVFVKSLREGSRDRLGLSLSLAFAPFFVLLYWLLFPSGSTTYEILVMNQDRGVRLESGLDWIAGEELTAALKDVTYANGSPLLVVRPTNELVEAERRLKDRESEALLIIPEDFSYAIYSANLGQTLDAASVTFEGDLTNPYYAVAAIMANAALDEYLQAATGQTRPVQVVETPLGDSAGRTEFEIYVPGLLVFAVIMLIFLAAMNVTREVEAGTLSRMRITRMTAIDLLGGMSAALVLIGLAAVMLTFLTAWAAGFRSHGPLWVAVLISVITCFSIIGAGLVVACFSRTTTQAFLIANFPLGLFMFFSGAVFPIPRLTVFELGGRPIGLFDILPPTHAVTALNKVLTLGAGLGDIAYELSALLVLSAIYFAAGMWLFQRRHLQSQK